jgi:alanine-glyoxylate transaminase/serine-glyoxylate transaminase/serine-pyruvate transaminase
MKSFIPPQRLLMGPGPSPVHPKVLEAMARPTIGHLDPEFIKLMDQIKELLKMTFCTQNKVTFPVSGPGSVGMEAVIANMVEPGEKIIVCQNGVFGNRLKEVATRYGGKVVDVVDDWGKAVDLNKVESALKANPDTKHLAFVHAETSTGALSDAQQLSLLAQRYGVYCLVDAVTSLGGVPLLVDEWKLDAVYSGSQKCLSCPPGLSPVTFSDRAVEKVKNRKSKVISWFLDITQVIGYWESNQKRSYHHTAPINALYGLHEGLIQLEAEGLEKSWARHQQWHQHFAREVKNLGLEFLVDPDCRLPQLNSLLVPAGVDEAKIRGDLLNLHGIEIGAGLGNLAGKIWRVGIMGQGAQASAVNRVVNALKQCLLH